MHYVCLQVQLVFYIEERKYLWDWQSEEYPVKMHELCPVLQKYKMYYLENIL